MSQAQSKRWYELDIAKSFSIFFMIQVHLFDALQLSSGERSIGRYLIDDFLGKPMAAPVFMFCMGLGLTLTRNASPRQLCMRGLKLLLTGFVLNIFRFLIPDGIGWLISADPMFLTGLYNDFISVDILQFAGLAFLAFSLTRRLKTPNWGIALFGVTCSLLGGLLAGLSTGNVVFDRIMDFGIRSTASSFFPFLNWILFPAAGYLFGVSILRSGDRGWLYRTLTLPCAAAALLFLVLSCVLSYGAFHESDAAYYGLCLDQTVAYILLCIGILGLCYRLSAVISAKALAFFSLLGRNLNRIYCISWVIVASLFLVNTLHPFVFGPWMATVLTIPVMAASIGIACLHPFKKKCNDAASRRHV